MPIEFNTTCMVVGSKNEIPVVMNYSEDDPATVLFTFFNVTDESSPTWIFGRDLLKEALDEGESGKGDVSFHLKNGRVYVNLVSPEGEGVASFEEGVIHEFVDMIYDEVPEGEDGYDVPDEIPEEWLV